MFMFVHFDDYISLLGITFNLLGKSIIHLPYIFLIFFVVERNDGSTHLQYLRPNGRAVYQLR